MAIIPLDGQGARQRRSSASTVRTDVVGNFPHDAALIRLGGMLLIEQDDEWLVGRRLAVGSRRAGVCAS
jgi:hypothetical protein